MDSEFEHLTKIKFSVSVADVASPEVFVLFKSDIPSKFKCIVKLVEGRFPELTSSNKCWKYFWIDEDGDEIVIANDADYRGFLKSINTTPAVARIFVRVSEPIEKTAKRTEEAMTATKLDDRPIHSRIMCNVCVPCVSGTAKPPPPQDVAGDEITAVKTPNNPDPSHIYSTRPHVNHAIHAMMAMGFGNDDGWLTRLIETLNGDVPKALVMLIRHANWD